MTKFHGSTSYLENYIYKFVIPKIEELFQEKYLEEPEISLNDVVLDYLSKHLEKIIEDAYDGEEFNKSDYLLNENFFFDFCLKIIKENTSESDLIESVSEPYRGLSDWERNNL